MPALSWYLRRLSAMSPAEIALHARKKVRAFADSRRRWNGAGLYLGRSTAFPILPPSEEAPDTLLDALRLDRADILAGHWKAFGHLPLQVDDPPRWHRDYLAGQDLATTASAFTLDHRELPRGADVKLIWEPSRWYQLVRLAMAAYLLNDESARDKCLDWLEDWVAQNPAYRGWNWTSALEVGIRLVQFTWIDALLSPPSAPADTQPDEDPDPPHPVEQRMERLRQDILPPHVSYVWRHQSVGSSRNNHLLGELAGCAMAIARWPALAGHAAPMPELQARWCREVLSQFAPDGGNREQALNYHLFAFELCWQALRAFEAAGIAVSQPVRERLTLAGRFFTEVQVSADPWDYGDSDGASVTPFFARDAVQEWRGWMEASHASPAIRYWLGDFPGAALPPADGPAAPWPRVGEWRTHVESGIATCEADPWWLRWDLSPLGYLSTAAHGHLDALHLSIWFRGVALIIDPGTGAYYGDERLRAWLGCRGAHNGPRPEGAETPRRLGPFLWSAHHSIPTLRTSGADGVGTLNLQGTQLRRRITALADGRGWQVDDDCLDPERRPAPFTVLWQFAPDCSVSSPGERQFSIERAGAAITLGVGDQWAGVELGDSIVSPAFRKACRAPCLKLTACPAGDERGPFRITFLASGNP